MERQLCGGDDGYGELQVSVSFGRFDKDSLSWEKWSSFSPNKYLEEVEKCATPGSVARKAAYFEAHYRRIAARKAELLLLASSSDAEGAASSVPAPSGEDLEEDEEEQNEEDMITLEKERLSFEVVFGESTAGGVGGRCEKSDEDGLVRDDDPKGEEPQQVQALGSDVGDDSKSNGGLVIGGEDAAGCRLTSVGIGSDNVSRSETRTAIREDAADLESWRKPRKSDPLHKEKIIEKAKKKPAPAVIKRPQLDSTPRRTSKPTPVSPAPSMTNSLRTPAVNACTKRDKGGPALDLKKVSSDHARRPASSSNLQGLNPAAAAAPRRSLIMDRMGDKDIIKRAFRTFQNHAGLSKSFSEQKSAPLALTGDASSTIRKENMRRESGTPVKTSSEIRPSKYGSGNIKRVEKGIININKKPEKKPIIKEAEKSRLRKDPREIHVRRPTTDIGFKATASPASRQGPSRPLSQQRKVIKKQETQS